MGSTPNTNTANVTVTDRASTGSQPDGSTPTGGSSSAGTPGTGTVTSVTAGTGLTGGTITTSGTIALATTAVTAGNYTNADITVDAEGRLTAAANGSSGGGGVTSLAAGLNVVLSGSTGAVTVAAFPSIIDAGAYLAKGSTLQQALTDACAANGCLLLPPGTFNVPAGGLVIPVGFTGGLSIRGAGANVTFLNQTTATGDVLYLQTTAAPGSAWFHCEGFSVKASVAAAGVGFGVKYSGSPGAQNLGGNCVFNDINSITNQSGGYFTKAFYFNNVWYSKADGLSGQGNPYSGAGLVLDSCDNFKVSNVELEWFSVGVDTTPATGPVGQTQGTIINNLRVVACAIGLNLGVGTNQGFWITNFMIDNGNGPIPGMAPVKIIYNGSNNGGPACLSCGQILANLSGSGSSADMMLIQGGNRIMVQNVDFIYSTGGTNCVHLTSGAQLCSFQACTFNPSYLSILADTGTTGSISFNNLSFTKTDNGSNNLVS